MLEPSIRLSGETVKTLRAHLDQAYVIGDVRGVRRISVLLEYLVAEMHLDKILIVWGVSAASVYEWLRAFMTEGYESLAYQHRGGRHSRLTPAQKRRLCELLDAGPQAAGFEPGCWTGVLMQQLIQREFGVLYNRFYVCELVRNLGYSYQKARFVSDHLDAARRQAWLDQEWPAILQAAQARQALILFGDEASFPQWGTLSYTWAKRGEQPTVKTSGKRKGYKVFGFIEHGTGRFFSQASEDRFDSLSYQVFVLHVLAQTTEHLFIIQDGAKYHTSKATQAFFAAQRDRITVYQLPSYSPDYNPIEYVWRLVKKQATHGKYFAAFTELMAAVDKGLAYFAQHPELVLNLFGRYSPATALAAPAAVA